MLLPVIRQINRKLLKVEKYVRHRNASSLTHLGRFLL